MAVSLGTLVGALAGYYRRWVDAVLMRGVDVGLALPRIFVLLMAGAVVGPLPLGVLGLVIGLTAWVGASRPGPAQVLGVRERDFGAGPRAEGAGARRRFF